MIIGLDIETYSELNLREAGLARYAETSELMLVAWKKYDDEYAQVWDVTKTGLHNPPDELSSLIANPENIFVAHNATFEYENLKKFEHLKISLNQFLCSMARCYAHGLPGALADACAAWGLPETQSKLKDGNKLVNMFCKPLLNQKIKRRTRVTHPLEWLRFKHYCKRDVESMMQLWRELPSVNYPDNKTELELWRLDQRMNARGVFVDTELCDLAIGLADRITEQRNDEILHLTNGEVKAITQNAAILKWLNANGCETPTINKAKLPELIKNAPNKRVKKVLELRADSAKTSTAKFKKIKSQAHKNTLKHLVQYAGAWRTMRWAGRGAQLQNMPGTGKIFNDKHGIEVVIDMLRQGRDEIHTVNPLELAKALIRPTIMARPGYKLIVADLSNIEGRGLAWLAGENWKLNAFLAADKGIAPDVYVQTVSRLFGIPHGQVTKTQRDKIGKVLELACGYGGWLGAFRQFGGDIPEEKAIEVLGKWRDSHPKTVKFWHELERACIQAVKKRGYILQVNHLKIKANKNYLQILLPGGRLMLYYKPKLETTERGVQVSYIGKPKTGASWSRVTAWHGTWAENVTQSLSRDVLALGMLRAVKKGFNLLFTVHDELVTEVKPESGLTLNDLIKCLTDPIPWAKGFPLAAAGYEGYRFIKD